MGMRIILMNQMEMSSGNERTSNKNLVRMRGPPLQTQWQVQGFSSESNRNESNPHQHLMQRRRIP